MPSYQESILLNSRDYGIFSDPERLAWRFMPLLIAAIGVTCTRRRLGQGSAAAANT